MTSPFAKPSLLRRLARAAKQLLAQTTPHVSHPDRVDAGKNISVHPSARFTVLDAEQRPHSRITLGADVYLGRNVELTAAGGGSVCIGRNSSLQDGDIVYGDVQIGAQCLLGRHVFIASRGHNFRTHPPWLIRDQDNLVLSGPPDAGPRTVIEDDCWIGQGVVVTPGVCVGRGAVIGANSVVTRDVEPYEVHGGVPNRKISTRLFFQPPKRIRATRDEDLPYFYRGFAMSSAELTESREQGMIAMENRACLVLAGAHGGILRLDGQCLEKNGALRLWINGVAHPGPMVTTGRFNMQADIPAVAADKPSMLRAHTVIEIEATGSHAIASAEILS
jgi:acetyltransferase-like isoleucine patch superfamily enzyme